MILFKLFAKWNWKFTALHILFCFGLTLRQLHHSSSATISPSFLNILNISRAREELRFPSSITSSLKCTIRSLNCLPLWSWSNWCSTVYCRVWCLTPSWQELDLIISHSSSLLCISTGDGTSFLGGNNSELNCSCFSNHCGSGVEFESLLISDFGRLLRTEEETEVPVPKPESSFGFGS